LEDLTLKTLLGTTKPVLFLQMKMKTIGPSCTKSNNYCKTAQNQNKNTLNILILYITILFCSLLNVANNA